METSKISLSNGGDLPPPTSPHPTYLKILWAKALATCKMFFRSKGPKSLCAEGHFLTSLHQNRTDGWIYPGTNASPEWLRKKNYFKRKPFKHYFWALMTPPVQVVQVCHSAVGFKTGAWVGIKISGITGVISITTGQWSNASCAIYPLTFSQLLSKDNSFRVGDVHTV